MKISNLYVIINSIICEWKDDRISNSIHIEKWVNLILNQLEEEATDRKQRCEICLSKEEPDELELHHIAGRKHDYRTITVCIDCHIDLSTKQRLWDYRWLRENQCENVRTAFILLGLHDVLELRAKKTGDSSYETLARMLIEHIFQLFKEL